MSIQRKLNVIFIFFMIKRPRGVSGFRGGPVEEGVHAGEVPRHERLQQLLAPRDDVVVPLFLSFAPWFGREGSAQIISGVP